MPGSALSKWRRSTADEGRPPILSRVMAERDRYREALQWAVAWIDFVHEIPIPGGDEQEEWERWEAARELVRAAPDQTHYESEDR